MKPQPTIADVARLAECSPATVSLVLNQKQARISPETARRVRDAAATLGYRASALARTLRTGVSRTIGIISDGVTLHRYASPLLRGILDGAEAHGFSVIMSETDGDPKRSANAYSILLNHKVDGIIIALMAARTINAPKLSVPTVVANGRLAGAGAKQSVAILPDEYHGGVHAAANLLDHGHRDIGIIGRFPRTPSPTTSITIPDRFRGIDRTLHERCANIYFEFSGSAWEPELGRKAAAELLANESAWPSAFLCANDRIAFGFHQMMLSAGHNMPEHYSLQSFDNEDLARYISPGLSTVAIPYREIGLAAIEQFTTALPLGETIQIPMPLVQRGSVAHTLQ